MPYIKDKYRDSIAACGIYSASNAGELNYAITSVVWDYLNAKGVCYTNINEVIGVLECAKLELYRRIAAPYEDKKRKENGDVYV